MIPNELTLLSQWVAWQYEERDGKVTKAPYQLNGKRASRTAASRRNSKWDGIGYVFSPDDPYTGVDFDKCLTGGQVDPFALTIVQYLNSFTEITPSRAGLHVLVRADLNGHRNRTGTTTPWGGLFECYSHSRYFTVTGKQLNGTPDTIESRQRELNEAIADLIPVKPEPTLAPRVTVPVDVDDAELLEQARKAKGGDKFSALYDRGDFKGEGYPSQSEADLSLCGSLGFWVGPDPARIDRLFRSSALMRPKWDKHHSYATDTITKALAGRSDFYRPPARSRAPEPPPEEQRTPGPLSPLDLPATVQPPPLGPPPLASDLRILDRFKADLRLHGVVGEERNGATLYLGITSRLLPKPVSLVVKGDSSSGKSFTTEQTVRFFPPEAIIAMTAMSEKALVYMKEEFSYRTLIIYEAAALKESAAAQRDDQTSYFVRSLISEGRLDYPVTVRDKDGGFVTKRIVKEGPTGLIITTTATRLHGENETRLLSLPTDDSRAQTKRVLLQISDDVDPKGGPDLAEWHRLQAWLQTSAERRVVIPFARRLAEEIPAVAVRLRRDFSSILNLIKAHAILHQLNRERDAQGRVVASVEDYAVVRDLVADLVADGVEATVSEATREAVKCVESLAAESRGGFR